MSDELQFIIRATNQARAGFDQVATDAQKNAALMSRLSAKSKTEAQKEADERTKAHRRASETIFRFRQEELAQTITLGKAHRAAIEENEARRVATAKAANAKIVADQRAASAAMLANVRASSAAASQLGLPGAALMGRGGSLLSGVTGGGAGAAAATASLVAIAGSIALIATSTKSLGDQIQRVDNLASQTGLGVAKIQILQEIAEETQVDFGTLSQAIVRFQATLGHGEGLDEFGESTSKLRKKLQDLGVDTQRGAVETMVQLKDILDQLPDREKAQQVLLDTIGIRAKALAPILLNTRLNFRQLLDEISKSNVVVSGEGLDAARQMHDMWSKIGRAIRGATNDVNEFIARMVSGVGSGQSVGQAFTNIISPDFSSPGAPARAGVAGGGRSGYDMVQAAQGAAREAQRAKFETTGMAPLDIAIMRQEEVEKAAKDSQDWAAATAAKERIIALKKQQEAEKVAAERSRALALTPAEIARTREIQTGFTEPPDLRGISPQLAETLLYRYKIENQGTAAFPSVVYPRHGELLPGTGGKGSVSYPLSEMFSAPTQALLGQVRQSQIDTTNGPGSLIADVPSVASRLMAGIPRETMQAPPQEFKTAFQEFAEKFAEQQQAEKDHAAQMLEAGRLIREGADQFHRETAQMGARVFDALLSGHHGVADLLKAGGRGIGRTLSGNLASLLLGSSAGKLSTAIGGQVVIDPKTNKAATNEDGSIKLTKLGELLKGTPLAANTAKMQADLIRANEKARFDQHATTNDLLRQGLNASGSGPTAGGGIPGITNSSGGDTSDDSSGGSGAGSGGLGGAGSVAAVLAGATGAYAGIKKGGVSGDSAAAASMLGSAALLAGPTPLGIGLAVAAAAAGVVSAVSSLFGGVDRSSQITQKLQNDRVSMPNAIASTFAIGGGATDFGYGNVARSVAGATMANSGSSPFPLGYQPYGAPPNVNTGGPGGFSQGGGTTIINNVTIPVNAWDHQSFTDHADELMALVRSRLTLGHSALSNDFRGLI